jgi:DNA-binding NarL/FixJ family response regulator
MFQKDVEMIAGENPIRVVLATDSFLLGDGLAAMLDDVPDVTIVGRAEDHLRLARVVDELRPDAVIFGIRTSVSTTMATIAVARHLRTEYPKMGFVVISDRANGFAIELLRGGAARVAYLLDQDLPNIETVLVSLRAVLTGESVLDPSIVESLLVRSEDRAIDNLTPREHDVLEQMASGLSNKAIAAAMSLSVKSIEKGVTAIFLKLGPFDPRFADRRVSASLEYLRAQSDPFTQFGYLDNGRIEQNND